MSLTPLADKLVNMAYELKGMKLGLEKMREVEQQLGAPSSRFKSVHVAGTNGKGSVCYKIASGLMQKGYKVGLYTSPHIYKINERIQINFQPISDERLEHYLAKVLPLHCTYFETITMAAFLYFAEEKIDYGVIEVGMGGRLDATNIITPEVAVITSIGMDHAQYLGNTLQKITFEKAGIMKKGVATVVGPTVNRRYLPEGEVIQVCRPFAHFEEENRAIAKRALLQMGMEAEDLSALPAARFECRDSVIYDVGHNLPALKSLFSRLKKSYPGRNYRVVAGFSADKDCKAMVRFLQKQSSALHLTRALHPRAWTQGDADPIGCFKKARQEAADRGELLVVCGSHFLIKDLR